MKVGLDLATLELVAGEDWLRATTQTLALLDTIVDRRHIVCELTPHVDSRSTVLLGYVEVD